MAISLGDFITARVGGKPWVRTNHMNRWIARDYGPDVVPINENQWHEYICHWEHETGQALLQRKVPSQAWLRLYPGEKQPGTP